MHSLSLSLTITHAHSPHSYPHSIPTRLLLALKPEAAATPTISCCREATAKTTRPTTLQTGIQVGASSMHGCP